MDGETVDHLPLRPAASGTSTPIEFFDDLAVLQRVADSLRALDRDLPPDDEAQPQPARRQAGAPDQ
ncbi:MULTISPECIES: hypothetical protein [Protofrankia]|uniref:Uncharacterized protein n=1 Tax=Candidatus Protofrankia datiscae TaxID=2716812 RepID=F8B5V1_9ACTN|nr:MULTISPECIES: hypothetical protein [Protofrankia]AEH10196.1 hypothetical protein FsymDg_2866 [Candidatus Protofrankia datiscae]